MTETGSFQRSHPVSLFSSVDLPAAAFAGVRRRRILGFCFDFVIVSVLALLIYLGLFILTVGMSALILPPLWPFVAFFYNGLTVAGPRRGTPGMRILDLEARSTDGAPVSFLMAGVHGALLYASWFFFAPIFLVSLFTADKRCLHDMLAGVVVVRRPD